MSYKYSGTIGRIDSNMKIIFFNLLLFIQMYLGITSFLNRN